MIDFVITTPALPIYSTNLSLAQGISTQNLWLHVSLLNGIYPLSNFGFHHTLARYCTGMEEDDFIEINQALWQAKMITYKPVRLRYSGLQTQPFK